VRPTPHFADARNGPAPTGIEASQIQSLVQSLQASQWWPEEALRRHQLHQLAHLLDHAHATVPFYRERLSTARYRPGQGVTEEFLRTLPVLGRRDVQERHDDLLSTRIPPTHGKLIGDATSGSTGMPVRIVKTEHALLTWLAVTMREELWHARDWSQIIGVIRRDPEGRSAFPGRRHPDWGAPLAMFHQTGPAELLDTGTSVAQQAEWLLRTQPGYLFSFPSIVAELARHCLRSGLRPTGLVGVRTSGEAVDPGLRELCRAAWGAEITDMYSAIEVGYIALQCPAYEHYHIQSESIVVEVVDERGRPCAPGEVGQVLLTSLNNYAMPLIRYATGDYAEVGEPCRCGRGLPVLERIVGRSRNMVTLPSGSRRFPLVGMTKKLGDISAIVQFQVAQTTLETIEVRLVARRRLLPDEEAMLRELLIANLGYEFRISCTYHERIPRSAGGKFFDFVSELAE
jgi:phenylacetate-CoA ligase